MDQVVRWRRVVALVVMAGALVVMTGCGDHEADEAFERATKGIEEGGELGEARKELQEIVDRWPKSRAAERARHEIEWIDEQLQVDVRGPSLLAWDAVREVAAAAEKFKLAHGRFPRRFGELVPRFVDGPVLDPWGHEIAYEQTESGYHVICYGEDGLPGGTGLGKDLLIDTGRVHGGAPAF